MVMLRAVPEETEGCLSMYRFNSGLNQSRECDPKESGDGEVAEYPPLMRAIDF